MSEKVPQAGGRRELGCPLIGERRDRKQELGSQ